MLQHLLNTSAIWLISLFLFDVFLRKESYHGYNRFYLLCTFSLGIAFPMFNWGTTYELSHTVIALPIAQIAATRQTVAAALGAATLTGIAQQISWWLVSYISGAVIAFAMLLIDIVKLVRFYKKGRKSKENGYTIIETGGTHTPFSFLNRVFVGERNTYSAAEWRTVMAHELQHATLLHI